MMKKFRNFLKKVCPVSVLPLLDHVRLFIASLSVRLKMCFRMPLKKKPSKLKFEIHMAEHCNLNCKSCSNFSPLADAEFIDPEEFSRDIARLGVIFSHECDRIWLMGGEPLLHHDINVLMKIARANFSKGEISIFTNGILLSKMPDEFWITCHDNNIGILISAYPINLPMNIINELASKFAVKVSWAWGQGDKERDLFIIRPVNLSGDSNIKLNFGICPHSVDCITLSHGRLYTCCFAPHVHHFNKYFGKNINITEADSVNIYDNLNAEEILTRLAEPIPACRYCKLDAKFIKWGISQKEISEWV